MADTEDSTAQSAETKPVVAANPFAALGGGAAFGGGGGFTFAAPTAAFGAPKAEGEEGDEAEGEGAAPEEECQAEFKPLVQLEEVETKSGEEEEEVLMDLKSKLYRFDNDSNEWKERGIGQAKFLQHKENKKVRLLMRQEKTLKIRANHIVMPNTKLQEHSGSDKAWVWSTVDFAEGSQSIEMFCLRFGNVERAQEFKLKFEEAMEINSKLIDMSAVATAEDSDAEAENEAADELSEALAAKATVSAETTPEATA
ncbi:MAG: hypothetical protein WDW36_008174 [Sanguina aurantia]